ncbi:hypothetical protein MFRU_008g02240 [Monilinia fructicola]|uniref:Mitochondrial export protein Som1 n=1 Tax=Monilinia fructicola TaxID=38448 RepID=A0A5M9JB91_MONFR|nr:hypothetical protein EYC84_010696 [Monilinia fructicola]KAG4031870.1 hypothetical protein MFRU_008g02240 [Monilinia fructicola]
MTPPLLPFSPLNLPSEAALSANSTYRKGFDGNLKNCELLELFQYNCDLQKNKSGRIGDERIVCQPVERLFRRCKDRKGTFMVETTVWEGEGSRK